MSDEKHGARGKRIKVSLRRNVRWADDIEQSVKNDHALQNALAAGCVSQRKRAFGGTDSAGHCARYEVWDAFEMLEVA
ncbi:hypothetical protein [Bradyrhizobium sp. ORS 375]|uniref:hypothetical protein n=1 Tax=Bradyrhizobium sp. (strain ORS 375) TaxID=566679 RepID=UPI0011129B26|nr:hypothetical protein [Bradyrhizobium sp. ORS 375]